MKKSIKILLIIIAILIIAAAIVVAIISLSKPKTNLEISGVESLTALVDKIYEGLEIDMPGVMTQQLDLTDNLAVQAFTGLENGDSLEYAVASEPLMSAQAYSLVLAKVKDGVNTDEIAKTMNENIDTRKWICVSAEKAYTTSSGDVVCLVMSREELAKPIYEKFKTLAGGIGQEFEKGEEQVELPADMY